MRNWTFRALVGLVSFAVGWMLAVLISFVTGWKLAEILHEFP